MPSDNTKTSPKPVTPRDGASQRRRYDSPLRRQQAAETQERILAAGVELVRGLSTWDLKSITARAVGERAGVSERTVHRHFPTERKLRDGILQCLVKESGVPLDKLDLSDFPDVPARIFNYLSSFSMAPITARTTDPELASMDTQRRGMLLNAVAKATPDWSDSERENAAAMLDILWNLPPYERLILTWGFDNKRATGVITWLTKLISDAIANGNKPVTLD